jgi:uncharacterized membrane protein
MLELSTSDFEVVLKPNCSLTPKGRVIAVGIAACFSFLVALGFALIGAWLVLPFAGLEVLGVAYAFYYIHSHAQDYESLVISGDKLAIEKKNDQCVSQVIFNRYWSKVLLRALPSGDQVLLLRSHGKEVAFGNCLMTNEQRLELAKELRQRIGIVFN